MTIKLSQQLYFNQPIPECDSCHNKTVHKIIASKDGEYKIGIRLCDDCLEKLKDEFK